MFAEAIYMWVIWQACLELDILRLENQLAARGVEQNFFVFLAYDCE